MPNSSRGGTCSALEGHEVAGSEACLEKANEALRSELAAGSSSAAEKPADAFAAWLARPRALMQAQRPAKGVPMVNNVGSLVSSRTRRSSAAALVNACAALGPSSYALRSDVDNKWRERCE